MMAVKLLMTPGFEEASRAAGLASDWISAAVAQLDTAGQPSWIIGDPDAITATMEDEGRTRRVPAAMHCWVIRDDHPLDCDCGCEGMRIVTFILPDDY